MKIALVAGESSGDRLGADLMQALEADFEGIGGQLMQTQGLTSLFPMEELSVMGVVEVLPKARHLLRRVRETAEFVIDGNFDALITIDSPDFSHRVAKRVKKARPDLPVIHYVAPSVWAWRAGRAKKMAHHVDHVLCLLPFEPPYMEAAGMSADFVGHPVARQKPPASLKNWMKTHEGVIGLFPGSRGSEISNHINVYREWAKTISDRKIMIPTQDFLFDRVSQAMQGLDHVEIFSAKQIGVEAFEREKNCLIYGADLAICTSGTISFELAWAGTNCIVGYRTSRLNAYLYKRLIKVKYASLANILLGEAAIPELLFEAFTAENLAKAYHEYLNMAEIRADQREKFAQMRRMMMPDLDAGTSVMRFLERVKR